MIKEIKKPSFDEILDSSARISALKFNAWFDREVEPVNEVIRNGLEVGGCEDEGWYFSNIPCKHDTHKALLIGITEIKQETPSDVLREMLDAMERGDEPGYNLDWYKRGRKALEGKSG